MPNMSRDDDYCSIPAYSDTTGTLVVVINSHVYIWAEDGGVQNPPVIEMSFPILTATRRSCL